MNIKVFDIAEHLNNEDEINMYLSAVMEFNDASLLLSAQEDIDNARTRILMKNSYLLDNDNS